MKGIEMNKGIKFLVVAALAAGTAVSSYAAGNTVANWSAGDITGLSLQGTTNGIAPGSLIEIGVFTVAPTVGSPSLAGFVPFAASITAVGTGGQPNGFWNTIFSTNNDAAYATLQAYIVAFNAPTTNAATQEGIYTLGAGNSASASWIFKHGTDIPNFISPDIEQLVSNPGAAVPTLGPGANIVYGSGPVDDSVDGYTFLQLKNIVVPEPSTYMLVGTGLLGLLGLRRRRS